MHKFTNIYMNRSKEQQSWVKVDNTNNCSIIIASVNILWSMIHDKVQQKTSFTHECLIHNGTYLMLMLTITKMLALLTITDSNVTGNPNPTNPTTKYCCEFNINNNNNNNLCLLNLQSNDYKYKQQNQQAGMQESTITTERKASRPYTQPNITQGLARV